MRTVYPTGPLFVHVTFVASYRWDVPSPISARTMGVMVASTISPLAGLCFKDVTSVNTGIRDETGLLPVQIHVEDPSRGYSLGSLCWLCNNVRSC